MKDKFITWLIEKEDKSPSTANSYSGGIDRLSEHLSNVKLSHVNLYSVDDVELLKSYSAWYQLEGKYAEVGQKGNGTYRNAIKAFIRFHEGNPKVRTYKKKYRETSTINPLDYNFDSNISKDASEMSGYYSLIFCLEVSLRNLVETTMNSAYGENWWNEKISPYIKDNVLQKIETENRRIYSKKSVQVIDYTTFRELRLIVENNWFLFTKHLKNKRDFIKITEDLNVIRNNIAHSIMLPEDEINRLKLSLNDWFRLKK